MSARILSLRMKGLAVVLVLLVFELIIFGCLYVQVEQAEKEARREGQLKEVGQNWEFREVKKYTIDDFMNIYRTYLSLNGGEIKEPSEIRIYPETLQLLEEVK